ncbi:MAG: NAD(P)/FAD-dependent oxidoreductase [Haloplanus sp.]
MSTHDVVIVGGGIFGCSVARYLSRGSSLDVALVEKEQHLAQHQSGRNSGTLHPGLALNLKPGTRKAKFAIEGGRLLRAYCEDNDLPIRNEGLMVVGTSEAECERLEAVHDRASDLDIDLSWLESDDIERIEPNVTGRRALYTRDSSTVLTADITYSLAKEAWNADTDFYMGCRVTDVTERDGRVDVTTDKGDIRARYLVNAAGVWAPKLAKKLGYATEYDLVPFRGQYYELTTDVRERIRTNVYPTSMPPRVPNSVGVHFTRRPDDKVIVGPTGMIALGPDTYGSTDVDIDTVLETLGSGRFWKFIGSRDTLRIAWTELNKTYRKHDFLKHCRRLMPDIEASDLRKSYVGISHYLVDDTGTIQQQSVFDRGPSSIHLLRPKPGLTSSLAIGEYVAGVTLEQFDAADAGDRTEPMPDPDDVATL